VPLFEHHPHPWREARKAAGPVKTADQHSTDSAAARFNTRVGLRITVMVGTMWCGWLFAAIALVSLPSALTSGDLTVMIAWLSSNFLQLVLLPIIIVGQTVQAAAADKRAEATYLDAESVLHEASEIQRHLASQDDRLAAQDIVLASQTATLTSLIRRHQDQLASQSAADRDIADQHLEATRQLTESVTGLHRRLDATPTVPPDPQEPS
jgi:hypothetical protein